MLPPPPPRNPRPSAVISPVRERPFSFAPVIVAALSAVNAPAFGQGTCNLPAPGAARPWEASIDVATYSSVNVRNGNLLTVVPVVGWSGVGPDVSFAFVHNSAHVDSGVDLDHTTGFNLGEGWQSTYSARLIFNSSTSTTVVHNDGRMDTYTKVSGVWIPPAGVPDKLEQHTITPKWTLTFKNQSRLNFNTLGRLSGVEDAHGNLVSLTRDNNYKLLKITDAAGRKLLFEYDNEDRLARIIDLKAGGCWPAEDCDCECGVDCECEDGEEPSGSTLINRVYDLEYDEDDRLWKVIDPEEHSVRPEVVILYDEDGRIASIEDKDGDAFEYTYHSASGAVDTVTDPDTLSTPYVQSFAYTCPTDPRRTTYTDRRGNDWLYDWSTTGTLSKFTNPLSDEQEFTFDMARNLTVYKDGLDNTWTFTYDSKGNLLKTFTPLMPNSGQNPTPKTERTYDSLNNLTSITDGEGNTVTLDYDMSGYPTLPTTINIPADGQGNGAAEITMTYFTSSNAKGQLESVTDTNGVRTEFEYDDWGQLSVYGEGEPPGAGPYDQVLYVDPTINSGGQLIGTQDQSGSGASYCVDLSGYPTCALCTFTIDPGTDEDQTAPDFPLPPCEVNPPTPAGCWTASYSKMGKLLERVVNVGNSCETTVERTFTNEYDPLGRLTLANIASEEWPTGVEREFTYDPETADDDTMSFTGPDCVTTTITLDAAGRIATLSRGTGSGAISAEYTYDSRGLVERVDYGNGAAVVYEYDDDQRLVSIEHLDDTSDTILKLEYEYDDRDLPIEITESDDQGVFATVSYTYDDRGKLILESRTVTRGPSPEYSLGYEYDQAGNRTEKHDLINDLDTYYTYDTGDPSTYGSDNNRLMYYEVWDVGGTPEQLSTTWYSYNAQGNVTRVVTEDEVNKSAPVEAVRFVYNHSQQVSFLIGEEWFRGDAECEENYVITWAREFRYDAARARYLNRELDPEALEEGDLVALSEVWTDYDGDSSYGDFELDGNPPEPSDLRSYEPGVALKDPWDESSGIEYYHADLIGSTRAMTDYTGASASTVCYTAFGEKLEAGHHRYGYAGSWGYQAHDVPDGDPVQFLHVGWRYYDPGTGRFLQRDPMGVFAGSNVYDYVYGQATVGTDPYGLVCQGCTQNTEPAIKLIDEKPMPEKDSEEPEIEAWVELDGGSVKFGTKIKAKSSWWQRFVNNCVTLPLAAGVYAGQKASDPPRLSEWPPKRRQIL
ncbi:MAG: hypothetical protein AMXMBFR22_25730 [Phycisphaerae bacterium]